MLQVYKYDENGRYVEPVLIETNEDGTYQLPDNCTDVELPQPNWKPIFDGEKWIESMTDNEFVADFSPAKIQELNNQCEETILGRFSVELDEAMYEFSYDEKAQSRFNGVASMFNSGLLTEMEWTCYLNGERQRVLLTKESFNKVALAALMHCNSNIVKFNELLVQVNACQTLDELKKIKW